MKRSVLPVFALWLCCAGCTKKTQPAVVIAKDYIPAHVEGAEYQERQTDHERWLVRVEMEDGRKAEADLEPERWKALNMGDRVQAKYSEGNYTGTIWSVDLLNP